MPHCLQVARPQNEVGTKYFFDARISHEMLRNIRRVLEP